MGTCPEGGEEPTYRDCDKRNQGGAAKEMAQRESLAIPAQSSKDFGTLLQSVLLKRLTERERAYPDINGVIYFSFEIVKTENEGRNSGMLSD